MPVKGAIILDKVVTVLANEEAILELLMQMNDRLSNLEQGQAKLEQGQAKLERGQQIIEEKIETINFNIKEIWKDISAMERSVKIHEHEFHTVDA